MSDVVLAAIELVARDVRGIKDDLAGVRSDVATIKDTQGSDRTRIALLEQADQAAEARERVAAKAHNELKATVNDELGKLKADVAAQRELNAQNQGMSQGRGALMVTLWSLPGFIMGCVALYQVFAG